MVYPLPIKKEWDHCLFPDLPTEWNALTLLHLLTGQNKGEVIFNRFSLDLVFLLPTFAYLYLLTFLGEAWCDEERCPVGGRWIKSVLMCSAIENGNLSWHGAILFSSRKLRTVPISPSTYWATVIVPKTLRCMLIVLYGVPMVTSGTYVEGSSWKVQ